MSVKRIIDEQYEIIRDIKTGGFGNIYYGWDLTLDRPVAIKEIVQSLLGEQQYVDMFIDEAMNTARLNHPNIVQIYSLRKTSDNRVFIVMQYIEGVDLKDVIDHFNVQGKNIPKNLVVFIVGEICKALEYAHSLKDRKTGEPLNIVHRDVSPSNIMLTVEGSVKLIDFGIAKARHRIAKKTQTGFVKGKVSYLSPEQLEGKEATRQSDIFSLGTVFYELCTGEQAFVGDSDFTIMKNILAADIDFSCLDDLNLPGDCCGIIKKALEREPSKRYASANQMYVDLYQLGRDHYPGEPTSELSRFVHEIFVKEPQKETDKPKIPDSKEKIKTQIISSEKATPPPPPEKTEPPGKIEPKQESPPQPVEAQNAADEGEARTVVYDSYEEDAKTSIIGSPDEEARTVVRDIPFSKEKAKRPGFDWAKLSAPLRGLDRRIWIYGGAALGVLIILLIIALVAGGGSDGPKGDYRVWINSEPEGAEVLLNGQIYGKTPLQLADITDGEYNLRLALDSGNFIDTQFVLEEEEQIVFPNFIFTKEIYINSDPQGAAIFVDNIDQGMTTPALIGVPIGDIIDIKLKHDMGKYPLVLSDFSIESGEFRKDRKSHWDYDAETQDGWPELIGRFQRDVSISSMPQGADIYIGDSSEPIGQTPGEFVMPFGATRLRLVKPGFEDKVRTVNINAQFQGSLFYKLYREVTVSAVSVADLRGPDIGASIYRIESEGEVADISEKTPAKLSLTGVEHKIYLKKDGFLDTSYVIGVNQTELKAVLSKKDDKSKPDVIAEEEDDSEKGILIFEFIDKKSKEPIAGVDVIAERKSDRKKILLGTSNEYGRLSVKLEEGKYNLLSSKEGYEEWDDGEKIKKNREYKYKVKLKKD